MLVVSSLLSVPATAFQQPEQETRTKALLLLRRSAAEASRIEIGGNVALGQTAALLARAGAIDEAAETAKQASPWTTDAACEIGKQLANNPAERMRTDVRGFRSPTIHYCVAEVLAEAGNFEDALLAVKQIDAPEVTQSALRRIAEIYAKNGRVSEAERVLRTIARQTPDETEQSVLDLYSLSSNHELAIATARKLKDNFSIAATLQSAATARAKAGDAKEARRLFAEAKSVIQNLPAEEQPLMMYFHVVAECQAGFFDDAFVSALEVPTLADERSKAFSSLSIFAAEANNAVMTARAIETLRSQPASEHLEHFYLINALQGVARAQANRGDFDAALQTLQQVPRDDVFARENRTIAAYAWSAKGDLDRAGRELKKVSIGSPHDTEVQAYSVVAATACRKLGVESCLKWVDTLDSALLRWAALVGAAEGLLSDSDIKLSNNAIYFH